MGISFDMIAREFVTRLANSPETSITEMARQMKMSRPGLTNYLQKKENRGLAVEHLSNLLAARGAEPSAFAVELVSLQAALQSGPPTEYKKKKAVERPMTQRERLKASGADLSPRAAATDRARRPPEPTAPPRRTGRSHAKKSDGR